MDDSFSHLGLALAVFLASHSIPALPNLRAVLVRRLGERGYLAAYSLLSLSLLGWLIHAALTAPYAELWGHPPGAAWIPTLVMPWACILLVAGVTTPNPLSFGSLSGPYDPARPGIVAITRHPVLWGVTLWAGAHLAPNGDVAAAAMFGLFTGFGFIGPLLVDSKIRRRMGPETWNRLAAGTAVMPGSALLRGRAAFAWRDLGWARVAGGLALYFALIPVHEWVFGVWPWPAGF